MALHQTPSSNGSFCTPTSKRALEGKVAIVTGGASGFGESTVKLFVKNGAKVVIADVQDNLGHSLSEELGSPKDVAYVHCDITSEKDVRNLIDVTLSKYGKLDIMFNNAGIAGDLDFSIVDAGTYKAGSLTRIKLSISWNVDIACLPLTFSEL